MPQSFSSPSLDLDRYPIPTQAFIGGEFLDGTSSEKHTLISSVNDAIITKELQWANTLDVDYAVEAAEEGLKAWQAMSDGARRDALIKYGDLIQQNKERFQWLEGILVGKDAGFCSFEVNFAAELFTYYGNMIDKVSSDVLVSTNENLRYTLHQPWGICAGIVPFNGPIITMAMKLAPALACGNVMIIKTSETNPFSTLYMASLANSAGIPPGVINCLTGGAEAGHALASHMKIRKISFTGSIPVGKRVQIAAAESNLKGVTLELGGKSPVIVFEDADIDKAVAGIMTFLVMNGQGCALGTRVYVHESVAYELISKVEDLAEMHAGTLGDDPLSESTRSSPLYHHRQKETVLSYIESGKAEATLVCGGSSVGKQGCYVQPTVFVDPQPGARIVREEIFGPVLVIMRFKTEEEVVKMANDTEFGLASTVYTKDIARALRLSRLLEAGSVHVNGSGWPNPKVPMTGWKQSGQGIENGREAMMDWMQVKVVSLSV
ncbi:aldehyde dehydrogenase domain-containing protein [Xylaria flabelliformis]|nr:aldehyde dehydrogenase domain-containing protein [Xylaria flabelliformis]